MRRQAGLRQARAEALLLKGDADGAAAHFETASGFLLPFAPLEAAEVRHAGAGRLGDEGARLGGTGLLRAIELFRRNGTIWTYAKHPMDWAATQNNLGIALRCQAGRTAGAEAKALLKEATEPYQAALTVHTAAARSVDWAGIQNNLGIALSDLGRRTTGEVGVALLAESASAHRAALGVFAAATHPMGWAMTKVNLADALVAQARRTPERGAALLAATRWRSTLKWRTQQLGLERRTTSASR